jgi:hypothetical protein
MTIQDRDSALGVLLQRGRARAGAELALLLLLLAQGRNTSIATACTDSVVIMFMLSDRLVAVCLF